MAGLPAVWRWSGRFLQAVRAYYPGVELVCEARITARTDPYLADYLVDGLPVLPTAMALEAMAQAASVLTGRPVRRAAGVCADSPVVVPAGGTDPGAVIRICALRDGDTVTVVLRCDESSFAVDHVRAVFSCDAQPAKAATSIGDALPELDEVPASDAGIVDGTELYGPICFQSGRFRRAALLPEVTSRSCRALVRGGDDQAWFNGPADQPDAQLILGSPGLTDATWHVLQACVPHRRLQLAGCDSVVFSGLAADGAVEVRAAVAADPLRQAAGRETATPGRPVIPRQGSGPEIRTPSAAASEFVWDVEAVDAAGRPLVTWSGLRLRDAGPLPRAAAWPPALLAAYLERTTAALGLDPELRVTVQCGPQDGAGSSRPAGTVIPKPAPPADGPARPAAGLPEGSPPAHVAPGRGALDGYTLTVWAPESAVCAWAAAAVQQSEQAGEPGTAQAGTAQPGTTKSGASQAGTARPGGRTRGPAEAPDAGTQDAEAQGPGAQGPGAQDAEDAPAGTGVAGGIRDDMRKRLSDPPEVIDARLSAVSGCLAAAEARVSSATVVGDGLADDGWVLVRAGGATIACTVVELSGIPRPVAVAIMTGTPGREKRPPVAAGQPRSPSRRQRGRAAKHTR